MKKAIAEKHELLDSYVQDDVYFIDYELPYEDKIVTATTKVQYCNYQSYITQVLCVNELVSDEDKR